MAEEAVQPLFLKLSADNPELTEIDSLCISCYKQGTTRLLLTKIPFFREVIISSFSCGSCGHQDTGIQPGGRIQEQGVRYEITVSSSQDLNRQVVKSDTATLSIPHLQFEQPPNKRGEITTIEGTIRSVISDLEMFQTERKKQDPSTAEKVEEFLANMRRLLQAESPFNLIIDDPSGNSFVENPDVPKKDESLLVTHYTRTRAQDALVGLVAEDDDGDGDNDTARVPSPQETVQDENLANEVLSFPTNCPECNSPCPTNMKIVNIPFFKEVVLMATVCEACGFRDNEVKGGQGIAEQGERISLHLTDTTDLSRDILKSDTAGMGIPELELELEPGTLGGRFTTVEGLLTKIVSELEKNPFMIGDSVTSAARTKMDQLCASLRKIASGERLGVHLIVDDPAGNSYIQNVYAPDDDPEMTITHYNRSHEQNEDLGLNDMKTENYLPH